MGILAAVLGMCAVVMFGAMPFFGHVSLGYAFVAILLVCGALGTFALSLLRRQPGAPSSNPSAERGRRLVVLTGGLWAIVAVLAGLATIVLTIPAAMAHPTALQWMELAFALLLIAGAIGWFFAYRRTSRR